MKMFFPFKKNKQKKNYLFMMNTVKQITYHILR